MTETVRVMMIGAPYKMHLYQSLQRHFPSDLQAEVVSASLGYGGRVPPLSRRSGIWFLPTKRMIDELIHFRPDIVFTDYPAYPSWYARFYSYLRRRHIPLVAWLLGDFWTEYCAFFSKAPLTVRAAGPFYLFTWSTGLDFADRILAVCEWLEEIVKVRFPTKSTGVFYQGIDTEVWMAPENTLLTLEHPAVGIVQDNNIFPKVRGLLWFSDVVKQMEDVHFYIAGGGPYTPLVQRTYSGLRNAHLVGRLPYPDGVRRFYLSTDAYVLPSGLDCCPTTLLEASLCAKPTIASKIGGIPELIIEGETGWTVQNGRSDQWVSKIRSVLEDPGLAEMIGENARCFVAKNFAWSTQATKFSSMIRDLLSEAK
jgi:glycosyltransferase involved in cell wall biosynthesis